MTPQVDHLLQQGLGCPWCGEHRMRHIHSRTVDAEPINGKRRFKMVHHCTWCNRDYTPPPASELPPPPQQPLSNLIKGVLYYTSPASGTSVDMARGVVTAVATTLMAERDILLLEAVDLIRAVLPSDYREEAIPPNWLKPADPPLNRH